MARYGHVNQTTDEERREFLKALGVAGALATGGLTLSEVREEMAAGAAEELAPVGQAIQADLTGSLDAQLIADQQAALASATADIPAVVDRGLPIEEQGEEFGAVAAAARPIYEHLGAAGFFQSTTEQLPEFDPAYLESAVETFVGSAALSEPLAEMGLTDGEGVDLLTEVVANAEELSTYHWVATDEIPRGEIEFGEHIPAMTKASTGGVLLWLEDLDEHLWQKQILLTDGILEDAAWHGRSMAAGLQLVSEGAKAIAEESGTLSDAELGALLSTGFAVQSIAQNLLPQDAYWITEEMRAQRA